MNLLDHTIPTTDSAKFLFDLTDHGNLQWVHEPESDSGAKFITVYDGLGVSVEPFKNGYDIYISRVSSEGETETLTFTTLDWKSLYDLIESKFLPPWNPNKEFIDFIANELKLGTTTEVRDLYKSLATAGYYKEKYMAYKNTGKPAQSDH